MDSIKSWNSSDGRAEWTGRTETAKAGEGGATEDDEEDSDIWRKKSVEKSVTAGLDEGAALDSMFSVVFFMFCFVFRRLLASVDVF
jgi:hypothetical protein